MRCFIKIISFISFILTITPVLGLVNAQPGENIAGVTVRVGETIDDLQEKICDTRATFTQCCEDLKDMIGCENLITQDDIPLTITESGTYCLAEGITGSGTSITIDADNVVLDLNDKVISGGAIGVQVEAGHSNILIKNGVIRDVTDHGITAVGTGGNEIRNLMVRNVKVISATNDAFELTLVQGSTICNCVANNGSGRGFSFLGITRTIIKECIAGNNGLTGFLVVGGNSCLILCKAYNNSSTGFQLSPENSICISCIAQSNGNVNFEFVNEQIILDCIAIQATVHGIRIFDESVNSLVRDCISLNNGEDSDDHGIFIDPITGISNVEVRGNISVGNTGDGVRVDTVLADNNRLFNNSSHGNIVSDYAGVGIDPLLEDTTPDASTGYWSNIS